MATKAKSKKRDRRAGRRHEPPAESADEMVEVIPKRRVFWGWDRKVMAVTQGSKVYASGRRPNTSPTEPKILVTITGDVTLKQAVGMINDVRESIMSGGWPGEDRTGTMSSDDAAESLKIEEQENVKFRSLRKVARPEFDETGPLWTDFEDIDRLREVVAARGDHPPRRSSRRKVTSRG